MVARVVFAMEWVPQYRTAFYDRLRHKLASDAIDVRLVHGQPPASRQQRRDDQTLPWAEVVANRFLTVGGSELTHQPVFSHLRGADLVILQQEAGLTLNYACLLRARLGGPPVALWGHGRNPNPRTVHRWAERLKKVTTTRADWIFAYTERSAAIFRSLGVEPERITVVQNAIDVSSLLVPSGRPSDDVSDLVSGLRERRARVGWIVTALDRWKRVDFLLEVLDATRKLVPDFEFVALGAGDDADTLLLASESRPWLHALGARFGPDKAAIGQVAEVTVHPGLAGLHVIEAFATASPMITAGIDYHSHEIDYLESEINAVILPEDADPVDFAESVAGLFADRRRLARLQDGCHRSAKVHTVDEMVDRFAAGVRSALAAGR